MSECLKVVDTRRTVRALEQPDTILVRFASTVLSPLPVQHELVDQAAHISGLVLPLVRTIEDKQHRIVYHVYGVRSDLDTLGNRD
jgi:hypothetical protein